MQPLNFVHKNSCYILSFCDKILLIQFLLEVKRENAILLKNTIERWHVNATREKTDKNVLEVKYENHYENGTSIIIAFYSSSCW